jgi:hypothetical protein
MQGPQINRRRHANFYQNAGIFSLVVMKGKSKEPLNILSFPVGEYTFSSVMIPRKEAAYVLKRFKKELDAKRVKA